MNALVDDIHSFPNSDASVLIWKMLQEPAHPLSDPLYIPLLLRISKMHRADCNAVIISLLKAFFKAIN